MAIALRTLLPALLGFAGFVSLSATTACTSDGDAGDTGDTGRTSHGDAETGGTDADAGVEQPSPDAESDAGFICRITSDCPTDPPGLSCEYWEPTCTQAGECLPHLGPMDANFSCFGICDCGGHWRGNVYTDFPFQRRDFNGDMPCTLPDGGPPSASICGDR